MAAGSFLALLDDIAAVLDDVALMSKVAAQKTAGVLGDDLALNAEQVAGIRAERELPVVWAVTKGSIRNKLILVPVALLLSAVAAWSITPLLMLGGLYLCYEGFEKVLHAILHRGHDAESAEVVHALHNPAIDLVAFEKEKIKGAIRTDFILSAEIIVIALGTVQTSPLLTQCMVVAGVAIVMTFGVYGIVAGIVKLDDIGLHLLKHAKPPAMQLRAATGRFLLGLAPRLMRLLAVVGTAAMFLVGGGILAHALPPLHHLVDSIEHGVASISLVSRIVGTLTEMLAGLFAGGCVFVLLEAVSRVRQRVGG